ncbi:MAG: hypothetical protein R6V04_09610 [bacterium]
MKLRIKENTFTASFKDGTKKSFLKQTSPLEIIDIISPPSHQKILLARVNNQIVDLKYKIEEDCFIEWLYKESPQTLSIYRKTLCFIIFKVFNDLFPDQHIVINYTLGSNLYCSLLTGDPIKKKSIKKIKRKVKEIIEKDEDIIPHNLLISKALEEFIIKGEDSSLLLGNREQSYLKFYRLNEYTDFLNSPLFIKTGYINTFDIIYSYPGFIINLPEKIDDKHLSPLTKQKSYFKILRECKHWEEILNIKKAADINQIIDNDKISELINVSETLHEKKIMQIAETITYNRKNIRTVLIGGPSSSGKTTFTKRLAVQLVTNGLDPIILSLDNYYYEIDKTLKNLSPTSEIESPRAVNIERLNNDVVNLFNGKTVKLPKFDFKTRKQIPGHICKLKPNNPVLIEGMHALDNNVTLAIQKKKKYKIYISSLTQLNITNHVRVPTSDIRLLRRLIRGHYFRNHPLTYTLHQWSEVIRGEEKYIFPFQENADIIFNSSLIYEPAVFRYVLKPLLDSISNSEYIYSEAQRLIQLLYFFIPLEPDKIPFNSILREFIGGSIFDYR